MTFHVVIPARYASTRLPGKPLLDLGGRTMIQRVVEQAGASDARQVLVATDDAAHRAGGQRPARRAGRHRGDDGCRTALGHRPGRRGRA